MSGPVALHGGGEFLLGDEPFLVALLEAARGAVRGPVVRAVVVPVAASRGRPVDAAAQGVGALRRVAADLSLSLDVEAALIVDAASAGDHGLASRVESADLIHLPGGDPDLVPGILGGTVAWGAIVAANRRGAVVAGASAGAMGLSTPTWTPRGFREGLGLVGGFVVVPHFESYDRRGREADEAAVRSRGLAVLGLDERTGVIREAPGAWRVAGEGRATWIPPDEPAVAYVHGALVPIPA